MLNIYTEYTIKSKLQNVFNKSKKLEDCKNLKTFDISKNVQVFFRSESLWEISLDKFKK